MKQSLEAGRLRIADRTALTGPDEQWRLIVEAAENGMLVVNEAGFIGLANAEAERIFGYARGALLGQPVEILRCAEICAAIGPPNPAAYVDPLRVSAAGGGCTSRLADGSTLSFSITCTTLGTGHERLVLVSLRAANRQHPTLEEHPAQRPVLETVAGSMANGEVQGPTGRWRFDLVSRDLSWSAEIYRIYGLPGTERPTLATAIAGYDGADRPRIAELVEQAIVHGIPYRDEARIVRPDGSTRSVLHDGAPERSPDGSITAIAGFFQDITERKNTQRERERLNEYVMLANQGGKIGVWDLDLRTGISVWDRNMYALYGIGDVTTVPTFAMWTAALHPQDRERAVHEVNGDIAQGAPSDSEFRVIWKNGEIHTIRSLVTIVCDESGAAARILGTDWDVTEIRSLSQALREEKEALVSSEARYRALSEAMPQLVCVLDAAVDFEYVNLRWSSYTGLTLEGSRMCGIAGVVAAADFPGLRAERESARDREFECEARLRRADGAFRWHLVRGVPFHDATGDAGKWIITATDIEERKTAEKTLAVTVAELEHIAHHDPMTDLPNRMLLMDRLAQAITQANRAQGSVIVLYVDLDRFKAVNDTLGHAAGDRVLKETGARIVGTLRSGDTASRVGGDEFIVVCAALQRDDDVSRIAQRIIAAVTAPIKIGTEHITVEASVGVSVYPADGFDADTLIRKADAAMYSAKQSGRNTFRRYSNEAHISIVAAAELEAELRHAIAAGQLVVHYQPVIDVRTRRARAAEALVRWQHPRRGLVPPDEFIAFAEERGLIGQIGDFVLHAACDMLARLRLLGHQEVGIGINVSALQFGKPGFVADIVAALERHALDPRRLTIEITESVVMGNTRATIETLAELRQLGLRLSIDDFGTGYSSLAYIKKFPISTLKIDRSFVRDIADDKADQAIAKTIITLAQSLDMRVVAEGVESEAQLAILMALNVDSIQGYLFSRPLPMGEFERFLEQFPTSDRAGALRPAITLV